MELVWHWTPWAVWSLVSYVGLAPKVVNWILLMVFDSTGFDW